MRRPGWGGRFSIVAGVRALRLIMETDQAGGFFLAFKSDSCGYGVEVGAVREIFWVPEITPLDEVPFYITGAVNFRGKVVPIMDLALRLGHPFRPYRLSDAVIILEKASHLLGVIVSHVEGVLNIAPDQFESAEGLVDMAANASSAVLGEARVGDEILTILNPETLFDFYERPAAGAGEMPEIAPPCAFTRFEEGGPLQREVLHGRAQRVRQAMESENFGELSAFALIGLGGERFGVGLEVVKEFTKVRQVTPIPCCPQHIIGNMNLRGDIVTLVDIRGVLNLPRLGVPQKAMIVSVGDLGMVGVPVDGVEEVAYLRISNRKPVPAGVEAVADGYLMGIAHYDEGELAIVDIAKILSKGDLVVESEV